MILYSILQSHLIAAHHLFFSAEGTCLNTKLIQDVNCTVFAMRGGLRTKDFSSYLLSFRESTITNVTFPYVTSSSLLSPFAPES